MILLILAIWFGYKKARDSGRNPWAWAAISGGVFIGMQMIVVLGFGVLVGVGQVMWGWSDDAYDKYAVFANIPAIVLSISGLWLIFRFLDKVPDDEPVTEPPPPPTFDRQA